MRALAGKNYRKYKAPDLPTSSIDQSNPWNVALTDTMRANLVDVVEIIGYKLQFTVDCQVVLLDIRLI